MPFVSELTQKIFAVTSTAKGRIDIDAVRLNRQLVNRFMKKNRNVMKFVCHILLIISHSKAKKNLKEKVSG